jgi:actin-like ATPase involved in cell morphogenesis
VNKTICSRIGKLSQNDEYFENEKVDLKFKEIEEELSRKSEINKRNIELKVFLRRQHDKQSGKTMKI